MGLSSTLACMVELYRTHVTKAHGRTAAKLSPLGRNKEGDKPSCLLNLSSSYPLGNTEAGESSYSYLALALTIFPFIWSHFYSIFYEVKRKIGVCRYAHIHILRI